VLVVLVLDLLGSGVETRPESFRTTSFYQRDGEITRILEREDEHDLLSLGI